MKHSSIFVCLPSWMCSSNTFLIIFVVQTCKRSTRRKCTGMRSNRISIRADTRKSRFLTFTLNKIMIYIRSQLPKMAVVTRVSSECNVEFPIKFTTRSVRMTLAFVLNIVRVGLHSMKNADGMNIRIRNKDRRERLCDGHGFSICKYILVQHSSHNIIQI